MYKYMKENAPAPDLTSGRLYQQILLFTVPVILSNLLQIGFNMADVMVVGRFAGAAALGSVGCVSNLIALFTSFLVGVASAVNVTTARYIGMHHDKEVSENVHTAFLLCLLIGICITLIGLVFAGPVLSAMHTREELIDGALLYIRIYFAGMPALAIYNYGSALYSALGNTRKPLIYLTLSGILNVILNLVFVILCKLDVAGVALSSVISQYLAALMIMLSLARSRDLIRFELCKLKFTDDLVLPLLKLGLSSGLQYSIFQIANVFVQSGVNTFDAVTVEGAAASANADTIVYDVMAAFYTACASFIGQNYGAGLRRRMLHSYLISMFYSVAAGLILGLLLIFFGRYFLALFTTEIPVIDAGMERLKIMGFSYCVSGFMDCTLAASRGLGKTLIPNIGVILGSCVFRIAWIYTVFAYFKTVPSLYLLYIFSWSLTAIAEIIYFAYLFKRVAPAA